MKTGKLESFVPVPKRSECQNCRKVWKNHQLVPVKNIFQRVAAGEPMPSGECPNCGALCQPSTELKDRPALATVALFIEGGVLQDVASDRENVRVILIDYDTEGTPEEDLHEIVVPDPDGAVPAHCLTDDRWTMEAEPEIVAAAFLATKTKWAK